MVLVKNYRSKNIRIDKARTGMTISQDIYSDTGMTLVGKDTVLNQGLVKKLIHYGVQEIYIKEIISEKPVEQEKVFSSQVNIKEKEEFKEFSGRHSQNKDYLKNQMIHIGEGKKIEMQSLFSISNDLLELLNTKNELFSFINNIENFDDSTHAHSVNVSLISHSLGQWLGFNEEDLKNIAIAGLLHDIGKTQIDKNILNKPGKLSDKEYEEIKKHPVYGFRIIENQDIPYDIKMAVLMHHERFDGSGYPLNASNEKINDYTKIISICDIYDAMTSTRAYRGKLCPFMVIRLFEDGYFGKLDTKFLMTFINNIAYCYLDNWAKLSNGEEGKIIFINKNTPSKPILQIGNKVIDLSRERDVVIESII